jgi:hypothetical protein
MMDAIKEARVGGLIGSVRAAKWKSMRVEFRVIVAKSFFDFHCLRVFVTTD